MGNGNGNGNGNSNSNSNLASIVLLYFFVLVDSCYDHRLRIDWDRLCTPYLSSPLSSSSSPRHSFPFSLFSLFSLHAPLESDAVSRPFLNFLKKKEQKPNTHHPEDPNPAARISILPFPYPPSSSSSSSDALRQPHTGWELCVAIYPPLSLFPLVSRFF